MAIKPSEVLTLRNSSNEEIWLQRTIQSAVLQKSWTR